MKIYIRIIIWVLVLSGIAHAGWQFEAETEQKGEGAGRGRVKGWLDKASARVEFRQSDREMFPEGSYLLTQDAGKTLYLVEPGKQTYTRVDVEKFWAMANQFSEAFKLTFEDVVVRKEFEKKGPSILGYKTRHYRFYVSYMMKMNVFGMVNATHTEVVTDVWTAPSIREPAMYLGLGEFASTGHEVFDQILTETIRELDGFVLKQMAKTIVRPPSGETTESVTKMDIVSLKKGSVPPETFIVPRGFREVEMEMPGAMGEAAGEAEHLMKSISSALEGFEFK